MTRNIFASAVFAAFFLPTSAFADVGYFPTGQLRFDADGGECSTNGPYAHFDMDKIMVEIRSAGGDVDSGDFIIVSADFYKAKNIFIYEVMNRTSRDNSRFVIDVDDGKISQWKGYFDPARMVSGEVKAETFMVSCI